MAAKAGSLSRSLSSPARSYAIPVAVLALLLLTFWWGFWPETGRSREGTLVFLSVGDFGAGNERQREVANQMAVTAARYGAQFIVSLGDNIYEKGVKDVEDPLFQKCFENVYFMNSLQKRWYMSLGDHDHRGSVAAEVAYSNKSAQWYLPALYYNESFKAGKGDESFTLDLFVTDSIGLEGWVATDDPVDRRFFSDYKIKLVGRKAGKKQLQWFKSALKASTADWKLVVGHRPVLTSGVRARYPAEGRFPGLMVPILEENSVDAYLSGHDHVGQHLEEGGVTYLGNGVGGYGSHDATPTNATVWADGTYAGFMLHRVTKDAMVTDFINSKGVTLHTATINHKHEAGDVVPKDSK